MNFFEYCETYQDYANQMTICMLNLILNDKIKFFEILSVPVQNFVVKTQGHIIHFDSEIISLELVYLIDPQFDRR